MTPTDYTVRTLQPKAIVLRNENLLSMLICRRKWKSKDSHIVSLINVFIIPDYKMLSH